MEVIYRIMENLLPFQFMQYDFMKNALLAMLIITPLFGILGTMIVNNKMAFFSDALGHSAFTGIAIGVILGVSDTNISMIVFAIAFAFLLNWIKRRKTLSTDTVISVFSSLGTAVGLAILARNGAFSQYSGLMVGDIFLIADRCSRSIADLGKKSNLRIIRSNIKLICKTSAMANDLLAQSTYYSSSADFEHSNYLTLSLDLTIAVFIFMINDLYIVSVDCTARGACGNEDVISALGERNEAEGAL